MLSPPAEADASVLLARRSLGEGGRTESRVDVRVAAGPRLIRIGLLGLGHVGQAVARLAASPAGASAGLRFRIDGALVRDVARPRRCLRPARTTTNPTAFLRGRYDVVVEALGGLEPARTLVARLLGRGIPVVTANKTLMAVAGEQLQTLAAARGTTLRYEASAMAGVPFLGTLAARPLVSAVDRFTAILNGTSNFILSALETHGGTFEEALVSAQRRGLTEPDPSRDLDGDDAADKLALLMSLLGWGSTPRACVEVRSVRNVTSTDLRIARSLGGSLKPIALAARVPTGIEAFIGPAWVPGHKPIATLSGTLNGIELHGRHVSDLFFSGPGAGPDITAATLLDDVVEAVQAGPRTRKRGSAPAHSFHVLAPTTPWFIRVEFPGIVPTSDAASEAFIRAGVSIELVTDPIDGARYLLLGRSDREHVDAAIETLRRRHRIACAAFRRLE